MNYKMGSGKKLLNSVTGKEINGVESDQHLGMTSDIAGCEGDGGAGVLVRIPV